MVIAAQVQEFGQHLCGLGCIVWSQLHIRLSVAACGAWLTSLILHSGGKRQR